MTHAPDDLDDLQKRAAAGDGRRWASCSNATRPARGNAAAPTRPRLKGRSIRPTCSRRPILEVARRFPEFLAAGSTLPFYLWVRLITGQKLAELHRRHLGPRCAMPDSRCCSTGARCRGVVGVLGRVADGRLTTASRVAIRGETQLRVQAALNRMDPMTARCWSCATFEMLSNEETACALASSPRPRATATSAP